MKTDIEGLDGIGKLKILEISRNGAKPGLNYILKCWMRVDYTAVEE